MKDKLLELFEQNRGMLISGSDIAKSLGVSRAAVNKAISGLRDLGYKFDATSRLGYVFSEKNDIISPSGIYKYLNGNKHKIVHLDEVNSTNTALKELAQNGAQEGTVVVTEMQTGGKGRRGKRFFSPRGCGVYFSLLLRPRLKAADSVFITVAASVAVRRAIKLLLHADTQIKWVNDVYFHNKKLCGILTEASMEIESGYLNYAVLGIGINIKPPENGYPEEFAFKTTNLSEISHPLPDDLKNKLIAEVLTQFDRLYETLEQKDYIEEYKEASCILGRKIEILTGPCAGPAVAEDIDSDANLIVRLPNGNTAALNSGDVSICL